MAPMSIEGKNMTLNDFKEAVSKMAAPTTSNGVYCIYIYIEREREICAFLYCIYFYTISSTTKKKSSARTNLYFGVFWVGMLTWGP